MTLAGARLKVSLHFCSIKGKFKEALVKIAIEGRMLEIAIPTLYPLMFSFSISTPIFY